jgi:hypothetical protein
VRVRFTVRGGRAHLAKKATVRSSASGGTKKASCATCGKSANVRCAYKTYTTRPIAMSKHMTTNTQFEMMWRPASLSSASGDDARGGAFSNHSRRERGVSARYRKSSMSKTNCALRTHRAVRGSQGGGLESQQMVADGARFERHGSWYADGDGVEYDLLRRLRGCKIARRAEEGVCEHRWRAAHSPGAHGSARQRTARQQGSAEQRGSEGGAQGSARVRVERMAERE